MGGIPECLIQHAQRQKGFKMDLGVWVLWDHPVPSTGVPLVLHSDAASAPLGAFCCIALVHSLHRVLYVIVPRFHANPPLMPLTFSSFSFLQPPHFCPISTTTLTTSHSVPSRHVPHTAVLLFVPSLQFPLGPNCQQTIPRLYHQ
eukprot:EG_transcript_31959